MHYREASVADIPRIQVIRNSVTENQLSNPNFVTENDCRNYLTIRGKGWVCACGNAVVGFGIVDLVGHNIWALFVHPEFKGKGIGRKIHRLMLDWYFSQTTMKVWLSTAFNTRAEQFYRKAGWTEAGHHGTKETRFEMTYDQWISPLNQTPEPGSGDYTGE